MVRVAKRLSLAPTLVALLVALLTPSIFCKRPARLAYSVIGSPSARITLKCAVPCKIFSRISSRKAFDNANVTISAATPIVMPIIAAIAVTRASRRL